MTPQRREVIGAAIVVGLALGGVSLAGLALAAVVIRAVPLQDAGQQPGGEQADGEPRPSGNLQAVTLGGQVFRQRCARCHGAGGQGKGSGPPLAGVGLGREEVEAAVREGIPPLMPAFANRLRPDQVQAVTDYVASLNRGTVSDQPAGPGVTRQWGTSRARMSGMGCPMMGPRR